MAEIEKPAALRRGKNTRNAAAGAKERLISAAHRCYVEKGIKGTTIAHIAAEAEVTRRTVYRYFASHDDILLAVFERVVIDFWQDLEREVDMRGDFGDCLAAALLYSIHYAQSTERHGYMFADDGQAITHGIYISNAEFLQATSMGLERLYERKLQQGMAALNLDFSMLAEWFNRLILSFLNTPSSIYQSDEQLLHLFTQMLAPIVQVKTK